MRAPQVGGLFYVSQFYVSQGIIFFIAPSNSWYILSMSDTQSLEAVASFSELEERVREIPFLLLYATRPGCGVCGALRPKIERMVERIAPLKGVYADLEEIPLLAGQLSLFSVPVLVVFIEGREALREGRNVSVPELEERLERFAALMG